MLGHVYTMGGKRLSKSRQPFHIIESLNMASSLNCCKSDIKVLSECKRIFRSSRRFRSEERVIATNLPVYQSKALSSRHLFGYATQRFESIEEKNNKILPFLVSSS